MNADQLTKRMFRELRVGTAHATTGPHNISDEEYAKALADAESFISKLQLFKIEDGHGTYKQVRPGLGVVIYGFDCDCSVTPHKCTARYSIEAWRA